MPLEKTSKNTRCGRKGANAGIEVEQNQMDAAHREEQCENEWKVKVIPQKSDVFVKSFVYMLIAPRLAQINGILQRNARSQKTFQFARFTSSPLIESMTYEKDGG